MCVCAVRAGDTFDVGLYSDPVFGTPLFKTVAGESRCPHEPGTVARESVDMDVDLPIQRGINPDKPAIFRVSV